MECESSSCNVYEALDNMFAGNEPRMPEEIMTKLRKTFPESVRMTWQSIGSANWREGPVLVRTRCMVQDALGAEYYAVTCKVEKDDITRIASGVLRDSFGDETVAQAVEHGSRHCYVMVPIPGATDWYSSWCDKGSVDAGSETKRARLDTDDTPAILDKFVAKFVDERAEEVRVNRVLDVYGLLSAHSFGDNQEMEDEESSSPTNLVGVPNLHVIHYDEVTAGTERAPSAAFAAVMPQLRALVSKCVGDELAADYIVMHLISSTYARADNATICALPLNVCGVKDVQAVCNIVSKLAAKVKLVPMTARSLSAAPFHSIKCYKTNRLQQGVLQLSDGTHLIIDETVTPKGKIEVSGHAEANLGTLHKVISEQRIEYEFGFYRCPFEMDVPVMVLSEERSRYIATPFRICLPADAALSAQPIDEVAPADLLDMRMAILRAKRLLKEVAVSGDAAKEIQEEFVRMCNDPSCGVTSQEKADKMSQLLILTRLVTVLRGMKEMTIESWNVAVTMERKREKDLNSRFPLPPTPKTKTVAEEKEN